MAKSIDDLLKVDATKKASEKVKKRAGRPKSAIKNDKIVHIYMTEEKAKELEKKAADMELSISAYCRMKLFG